MKKNVFVLMALALLVTLSLTSCAKKKKGPTEEELLASYMECSLDYPEKSAEVKMVLTYLGLGNPKMENLLTDKFCKEEVELKSCSIVENNFVEVIFTISGIMDIVLKYDFSHADQGVAYIQSIEAAGEVIARPINEDAKKIGELYGAFQGILNMCFKDEAWK